MPLLAMTFDLDEKARATVAAELSGKAEVVYLTGLDDAGWWARTGPAPTGRWPPRRSRAQSPSAPASARSAES